MLRLCGVHHRCCSRGLLGWTGSATKETGLVPSALRQALFVRRRGTMRFTTRGLVHHSDAGSQYTSIALTEQLREAGIAGSIGTVGDALHNALMECTTGLYKTELIHANSSGTWAGRQAVEVATAHWVHWFNHRRIHSAKGYRTPIDYESDYHQNHAQEILSAWTPSAYQAQCGSEDTASPFCKSKKPGNGRTECSGVDPSIPPCRLCQLFG
jgi:putative transposase